MQKQLIAFLLLLFVYSVDNSNCKCKAFENNIYQTTVTLPNSKPFYGLLTLLPNGMYIETNNIANGQAVAEVGLNLPFNVHTGYYECLTGNKLNLITFGYVYKTNASATFQDNGAIVVHDYDLQFLNNDNRECNGTLKFAFYTTGSNPFDSGNKPLLESATANVTCEYFSGRGFELPASS